MLTALLDFELLILELVSCRVRKQFDRFRRRENTVTKNALAVLISVIENDQRTAVRAHTLCSSH